VTAGSHNASSRAALGSSFLRGQKALFNSEAGQSSALALTAASSFIRFLTAGMYG